MKTYREIAWIWMSASGANSEDAQREDFKQHTLEFLADDCIRSWDDDTLDREQLIEALADYRDELTVRKEK